MSRRRFVLLMAARLVAATVSLTLLVGSVALGARSWIGCEDVLQIEHMPDVHRYSLVQVRSAGGTIWLNYIVQHYQDGPALTFFRHARPYPVPWTRFGYTGAQSNTTRRLLGEFHVVHDLRSDASKTTSDRYLVACHLLARP